MKKKKVRIELKTNSVIMMINTVGPRVDVAIRILSAVDDPGVTGGKRIRLGRSFKQLGEDVLHH